MDEAKSYLLTEAAELTGLSVPALRKRIVRKTLRGFRSNEDGLWRVWLAVSDIASAQASQGEARDTIRPLPVQVDVSSIIKALEGQAAALRDALTRAQERVDKVEGEVSQLRERVGRAEGERDAERGARERAEADREIAQAELAEWKAGGPIARALRGLFLKRKT